MMYGGDARLLAFNRRSALAAAGVGALGGVRLPTFAAMEPAVAVISPLCDPCVTTVQSARGQEITLVGTAHISEDSAELVSRVIRSEKPDVVMIELDASRAAKLIGRASPSLKIVRPDGSLERTRSADVAAAPSALAAPPAAAPPPTSTFGIGRVAGRMLQGDLEDAKAEAVGAGLSTLYKQLDTMGFQSGQEFVVAVREADALGANVLLGDRDARQTVRRMGAALSDVLADRKALENLAPPPAAIMATSPETAEFTRENVLSAMAVLKQRENVRALAEYLRTNVPALYEALIAERDRYMAASILGCEGQRIVAVVGLAHVDGIEATVLAEKGTAKELAKPRACDAQRASQIKI